MQLASMTTSWRRGHKQICKRIHRGGNAEQYHANKKYKEAVAVAVEACADDTKGQTCYICTQALHWKTKEGLVRMCACRGTSGFAHVSCLAEQAKILFAEVPAAFFVLAPAGPGRSRRAGDQTLIPQAHENLFELSSWTSDRRTGFFGSRELAP